jgi:predicted DNA-binding transcriptional regulator YafY
MVYLNDLCQEFTVSEKTIKRDIQLLKTYGEDIRYDHKKNGYYLLLSMNGISRDWI